MQQVIAYLDGDFEVPKIESIKQENLSKKNSVDFSEVKGQENVKRALEIAAARWTQLPAYSVVHGSRKNHACKKNTNNFARNDFRRSTRSN